MNSIALTPLENIVRAPARWPAIARQATAWADARGVALRDAIVLVPFLQLLPQARRAFAAPGGWMPRIETTRTLAASFGPVAPGASGQLTFDAVIDALTAAALLRAQAWGAAWARRDARGFEQAVAAVVVTAQAFARAAAALPPTARAAHWARARETLMPINGPGASERLLARIALEWASFAPAPASDRLFETIKPSAWIVVRAGGADALAASLIAAADVPALLIDTDALEADPFADAGAAAAPAFIVCDSFEQEAQSTAAQILAHVGRGEAPVALIAQDRLLVRRVRALLERHRLRLHDETGWKLSTTRAAVLVVGPLRAARADATTDALLDWLKAASGDADALDALEATCRRQGVSRVAALDHAVLEPPAARLWARVRSLLSELQATPRRPLAGWIATLASSLDAFGTMAALRADDAGRQVLDRLRLETHAPQPVTWATAAAQRVVDLREFTTWAEGALEQATFRPTPDFDDAPDVVVTPLAGAMLRSFAAIVMPGADDKHLGAPPAPIPLLGDTLAASLGLPTAANQRRAETLAFVHLLAAPRLTLLRRRVDDGEPLADSPLVERLALALAARGRAFETWHDTRIEIEVAATPIRMTAPAAGALLPARLSASACEALRACPYRFFALNMLRLREDEELERDVEKRDYGTWLHAVLHEFHATREAPAGAADEIERLVRLARASQADHNLADADFLPFAASFESFAPRYIAWLHRRDADGARWLEGEQEITLRRDELGGTELRGIVDRIDERGAAIEVIDYKTGSAAGLREKVKRPLEDTQLAFYAALMRSRTALPLAASYLALDGSKGLEEIEHEGVEASAAALVAGLADDLARLRAGAGLPALGEGATCEHCAARGVCRRDHWQSDAA
jgi:ATP-dependent helicase/nuclease subunit B